jgi:NIPSNAP
MICIKTLWKSRPAILLLLAVTTLVSAPQKPATVSKKQPEVIHQLRIYEIFDGNKRAFHDRFRDHAMRIMARYDFKIIATWETKKGDRTEFAYLLEWPDKETMRDRWTKFMADQEWSNIKKETSRTYGTFVGEIEDRTLELTDYSPRREFRTPEQSRVHE